MEAKRGSDTDDLHPRSNGWRFDADDALDAVALRPVYVAYLRRHGHVDSDFDGAELVFGELVGNVISHAPGAISIIIEWCEDAAVLHVIDFGDGFTYVPVQLEPGLHKERGRGLAIVATLADGMTFPNGYARGSHVRVILPVRYGADPDVP